MHKRDGSSPSQKCEHAQEWVVPAGGGSVVDTPWTFQKEEIPQRHRSMGKLSKTRKKWFLCQVNYGSEIKRYRNNIWPTACLMWLLTRKGKCFNHIKKTIREKWRMNGVHKCWNQIFFFLDSFPLFYWKQWERISLIYHRIMMEMRKEQEEL